MTPEDIPSIRISEKRFEAYKRYDRLLNIILLEIDSAPYQAIYPKELLKVCMDKYKEKHGEWWTSLY